MSSTTWFSGRKISRIYIRTLSNDISKHDHNSRRHRAPDHDRKGIPRAFIFCDVASTFGGGTLTLGIRRAGSTDDLMAIDTVIPGDQDVYLVGGLVELHYTLAGSTSPSIEILVRQGL